MDYNNNDPTSWISSAVSSSSQAPSPSERPFYIEESQWTLKKEKERIEISFSLAEFVFDFYREHFIGCFIGFDFISKFVSFGYKKHWIGVKWIAADRPLKANHPFAISPTDVSMDATSIITQVSQDDEQLNVQNEKGKQINWSVFCV